MFLECLAHIYLQFLVYQSKEPNPRIPASLGLRLCGRGRVSESLRVGAIGLPSQPCFLAKSETRPASVPLPTEGLAPGRRSPEDPEPIRAAPPPRTRKQVHIKVSSAAGIDLSWKLLRVPGRPNLAWRIHSYCRSSLAVKLNDGFCLLELAGGSYQRGSWYFAYRAPPIQPRPTAA